MKANVMKQLAGAFALVFVFLTSSARAQENVAAAREHFLKGTKAFDLGLYEDAIKEYMSAYQIKDDPAFLYNIAQAHRLAGHDAEALRFYRMYLTRAPDAPNRAQVEARISELRAKPPVLAPPQQPATVVVANEAPRSGRTLRLAGVSLASVGVGALVGGIVAGVFARSESDALTQAGQVPEPWDPSRDAAGRRDQILQGVFLAVGGAGVVGGVTLYLIGHARDRRWTLTSASLLP
jgi:tetratricopeptide (TPR) repeat protein